MNAFDQGRGWYRWFGVIEVEFDCRTAFIAFLVTFFDAFRFLTRMRTRLSGFPSHRGLSPEGGDRSIGSYRISLVRKHPLLKNRNTCQNC